MVKAEYEAMFADLPGGQAVIDWFGYAPSFHDAKLTELSFASGNAELKIAAFRMTSDIDERGYFVLDRHAMVILSLARVTGVDVGGEDAHSIISELTIRRLKAAPPQNITASTHAQAGEYEVMFGSSYGLAGSIFAREIQLSLEPCPA